VTLWLPLVVGFGAAYHPNPTDAKTIGELAAKYGATLLISTPTFCAAYVRKCPPEQFARLRLAIVGAERLREPIAAAFRDKFGVELLEGYGCTEMAPVVAVNVPEGGDAEARRGSVGRPLPGISAKIVDPETGEGPLVGKEGLLLVNGPNRMVGYHGEPELTQAALRDGWYVTGDIATIDEAGYIRITDRLSRFSKIAGEMVPHMKVEERLQALLHDPHVAVVTSVPDPAKGERLVALYTDPGLSAQEIWEQLSRSDLPKLWIPKREDLHLVESIPTLGTGKVDLRGVRQLAVERSQAGTRSA
jgi:acyl-[acyl-carrier-protein]-phospholipid O-acyltransferase/long-chain-fatty-acid--[acyl-carrier-protein] ligase